MLPWRGLLAARAAAASVLGGAGPLLGGADVELRTRRCAREASGRGFVALLALGLAGGRGLLGGGLGDVMACGLPLPPAALLPYGAVWLGCVPPVWVAWLLWLILQYQFSLPFF